MLLPMYYLMNADYYEFESFSEEEKIKYTKDYWNNSSDKQLLKEFYKRVLHVNKKYGYLSTEGWETDRGRIYIIYGEPHIIDESYQDKMGYTYKKWVYLNGKQFIFVDRNMSGDYSLYREMY